VEERSVHGFSDGEVVDLRFPSAYRPFSATVPARMPPENSTVYVRHWRHSVGAPATIVAIHGWTMGDQRINSLAFVPGMFYLLGLDVAIVELPLHGRRAPRKGERPAFPGPDVIITNEAIGQIISDLRELTMFLKGRGVSEVGVIGVSLGAYVAALWSSLEKLSFCIPIVPLCSMAEVAWEIVSRRPDFPRLQADGLSIELLRNLFVVHSPLIHKPKHDRTRALIIAGIADKMVPARQTNMLWGHWHHPQLFWFDGGHAAQFKRSGAYEEIKKFLVGLGYIS
jgi:Alpha/beta hydrolase domain containing 18